MDAAWASQRNWVSLGMHWHLRDPDLVSGLGKLVASQLSKRTVSSFPCPVL